MQYLSLYCNISQNIYSSDYWKILSRFEMFSNFETDFDQTNFAENTQVTTNTGANTTHNDVRPR